MLNQLLWVGGYKLQLQLYNRIVDSPEEMSQWSKPTFSCSTSYLVLNISWGLKKIENMNSKEILKCELQTKSLLLVSAFGISFKPSKKMAKVITKHSILWCLSYANKYSASKLLCDKYSILGSITNSPVYKPKQGFGIYN